MNFIKTFTAGEAFGEIALMTKQRRYFKELHILITFIKNRTGSIVCRENTYLMALTKENFDAILGSYHKNIT